MRTQLARAARPVTSDVWFYYTQISAEILLSLTLQITAVQGRFGPVLWVLARSAMQSAFMHEKTIARSHSVLMHAYMAEDLFQLKGQFACMG